MIDTDKKQLEVAMYFTEFQSCESALKVCMDLYAMEQTPYLKDIRSALKSNKRKLAMLLMKHWLSLNEK